MQAFNDLLDRVRLTSVLTLILAGGGLYCLVTGQITFQEFGIGLGVGGFGAGMIGKARNDAGHGTSA